MLRFLFSFQQLEYEKLSQEYYQLEEKKRFHISNREMIAMEQEGLEREAEKLQQNLYLLACARICSSSCCASCSLFISSAVVADSFALLLRLRKKKTANQELEQEKNRKAILERKIASLREERTLALAKQEQRQQLQEDYEQELSQRRATFHATHRMNAQAFKFLQKLWRQLQNSALCQSLIFPLQLVFFFFQAATSRLYLI